MALEIINGPIIAAGESLSAPVDLTDKEIVRITMPAGWDNANLTFQISTDGQGFNDLFTDDGKESTMVVTIGAAVVISDVHAAVKKAAVFLKFRSGTRSHPVVQTAQRDFALAVAPVT
jgi:hypothetical protein